MELSHCNKRKEVTAEEGFYTDDFKMVQLKLPFTFDAASSQEKMSLSLKRLYKVTIDTNGKTHEEKTAQHEDLNDEGTDDSFSGH